MDYRTPKIIQPGALCISPWFLLILILASGALFAWMALSVYKSSDDTLDRAQLLQDSVSAYAAKMEALEAERDRLLAKNAALERASQIDRDAVQKIRDSLKQDEEARLSLEEELASLKGILADKESREALRIVGVELSRTEQEHVVRYRFTVRKTLNDGEISTGSIFLAVDGKSEGNAQWYPLRELTDEKKESLRMKFKHFQDIEGTLRLPPSFDPGHLVIEIKPADKKLTPIKERFEWLVKG